MGNNAEDFENSIKLTKNALLLSGIDIYNEKFNKFIKHLIDYWLFYLNFLWLYVDVAGEFFWLLEGIKFGKSFDELSMIAPCITVCLLATVKSTPTYYCRDIVKEIVNKLRTLHPDVDNNDEEDFENITEESIIKDSTKSLKTVINIMYGSWIAVVTSFCSLPLITMTYVYYKTGLWELKLPFLVNYYFDPFKVIIWPFVYFHQVWSRIDIYNKKFNKLVKHFVDDWIFYLNFIWMYTDVIGEFYWLLDSIGIGKSFVELSMIAPCITICLLATAKSASMYYNKNVVLKVIHKIRRMHPHLDDNFKKANDGSFKIEKDIVRYSIEFLKAVILILFSSSVVVILAFTCMPLLAMTYVYYNTGVWKLKLPFLVKYNFDPYEIATWPFVYLHQMWATIIAGVNIFCADTFIYAFCAYVRMHFLILAHRFEHIVSKGNTKENLRKLIMRHQELIELVDLMESLYSKSTLFNIVTSSVLICLSCFNITFCRDMGVVFAFVTFLIMSLSQISLLCYFGDMLTASSTELSRAIYNCRWYDANHNIKKSVLLVITRAQKPCKLTAWKFADLNLNAFTTILSRSWSYFALLKTIYD